MQLLILAVFAATVLSFRQEEQQVLRDRPVPYRQQTPPLDTPWTDKVGTAPFADRHPSPKLQRTSWQSLNGIWTYANASGPDALKSPPFNETLTHEVLVPSCLESGLSGIQGTNTIYSWYQTTFVVPTEWPHDEQVILNFGAVDYEATVFVNGQNVSFHRGGFFSFSVDVTTYLNSGHNELVVFAFDPTDGDGYSIPKGKQALDPSHIFYRPCSGIWQSVWIESVPQNHISDLYIDGDANGKVDLTIQASQKNNSSVGIVLYERHTNHSIATYNATTNSSNSAPISFQVNSPKTWSPDAPNLYDVVVTMDQDVVRSYIGFRTIESKAVNGVQRVVLNGDSIFPFGTLDQGYWPDGLYVPPTYEAMQYDIQIMKRLGYNMLRKHVKVEPHLYYAAADELGILIMQDMPNMGGPLPNSTQQEEFQRQLELMVKQFRSYSCIFTWVIYNEGWGQKDSPEIGLTDVLRALDPSRLVNAVSGWNDHGAGDYADNHHYTSPQCGVVWSSSSSSSQLSPQPLQSHRIGFQGEFGGHGHNVSEEHLWKVPRAIDAIDETYEMYDTLAEWNLRGRFLLRQLQLQIELYACAGAVWTQTTDVEGEVNGMMTYDRRMLRTDVEQWRMDIEALYDAAARRADAVGI